MPSAPVMTGHASGLITINLAEADAIAELDRSLDRIGQLQGIERTQTLVVLSTKFER